MQQISDWLKKLGMSEYAERSGPETAKGRGAQI
jgi:hypothetical protein